MFLEVIICRAANIQLGEGKVKSEEENLTLDLEFGCMVLLKTWVRYLHVRIDTVDVLGSDHMLGSLHPAQGR